MTGVWKGRITVQTQRGQATVLLERLTDLIMEEERGIGITPSGEKTRDAETRPMGVTGRMEAKATSDKVEITAPVKFVQEPGQKPEWFVSYAWGDGTPEGRDREKVVDHMCRVAEQRGITVLRDKRVLGLGDRISKFMQRIGRSDRVFIILSDKYLKLPYCMYELFEVWRICRQSEDEFLNRIRIYALPDAKIRSPLERAEKAAFWRDESAQLEALVNKHGFDLLGEKDYKLYKLMKDFSRHIGDILATVADIVQPRTFEEFEKYGFDENDKITPP